MIQAADGKNLGTMELFDFDPYHSRAGVGIVIFESSDRRTGIATEAFEILFDYVQNELGIAQLYANVAESNEPSLKLFGKLGFELAGVKKKWLRTIKGWENEHLLQKIFE